jgi:hypothetical protein
VGRKLERVGSVVLVCVAVGDGEIGQLELVNLGPGDALFTSATVTVTATPESGYIGFKAQSLSLEVPAKLGPSERRVVISKEWLAAFPKEIGVKVHEENRVAARLELVIGVEASSEGGDLRKRMQVTFHKGAAALSEPERGRAQIHV